MSRLCGTALYLAPRRVDGAATLGALEEPR